MQRAESREPLVIVTLYLRDKIKFKFRRDKLTFLIVSCFKTCIFLIYVGAYLGAYVGTYIGTYVGTRWDTLGRVGAYFGVYWDICVGHILGKVGAYVGKLWDMLGHVGIC
jgi:hypothetical protein